METVEPGIIQAILLSDGAIREAGTNKLSLIGTFSAWNPPSFPFHVPPFFITLFLTNVGAIGQHTISIRVEELKSRTVILSIGGTISIGVAPGSVASANPGRVPRNAVIEAPMMAPQGINFTHPGVFRIFAIFDGEDVGSRDFDVNPPQLPSSITPGTP